ARWLDGKLVSVLFQAGLAESGYFYFRSQRPICLSSGVCRALSCAGGDAAAYVGRRFPRSVMEALHFRHCWTVSREEIGMKAVRIHEFGRPEVLRYEDVPDPQLRKDQVLVGVKACSLNHLDLWARKGLPGIKLPHILGSDVAGQIVEVGEYVGGLSTGQRVLLSPMTFCGRCAKCAAGLQNECPEFSVLGNRVDGGNCELIAARPDSVFPIPDSLDFNQAASVPL